MDEIENLVTEYPYCSMDTEFPGTAFLPNEVGPDFEYQVIRTNVNKLKVIQVGFTMADKNGRLPKGHCCWQFNLAFDLRTEKFAPDSIKLL